MLLKALLWLTGQIDADATPRNGPPPVVSSLGADSFAPSGIVVVSGDHLTSGSFFDAPAVPLPVRLAGTHAEVNGMPAPLFSVKPDRVLLQLPAGLAPGQPASLQVSSVNLASAAIPLRIESAAPAILGVSASPGALVIYCTGLGATDPPLREGLAATGPVRTVIQPAVTIAGAPAAVFYSGLTPGLVGVYQVNVFLPAAVPAAYEVALEAGGHVVRTTVR
jgi:uncharacterized protein (TIGR03437 family)